MKKNLLKLMLLSGAALLAVSCGGGNGGGGTNSASGSSASGAGSGVEILFWHTFGQTIQDNLNAQLRRFKTLIKQNDGVDVTVKLTPFSDYATINSDISTKIKTNDIPTIAVCYPDHVADYLLSEGNEPGRYIVDLNTYINDEQVGLGKEAFLGDRANDSIDDFYPAFLEGGSSFSREGQLCIPYMKSTESMLYNYTAVQKVLVHYKPEFNGAKNKIEEYMNNLNWAEFMELCKQAANYKAEFNPDLKQVAYYDSDANLFISQLFQSGIPYSSIVENEQGKKGGHIDFAEGQSRTDAEELVGNLKKDRDTLVNGVRLFNTKGTEGGYGSNSFKDIESIFVIGSTGGSGYSLTDDFEIGVCRVPPVDTNNALYVTQGPELCMFNNPSLSEKANRERTLYAWKLIKFLTNPENNCQICLQGSEGYLPVRKSAYSTDLYLDFMETMNEGEFPPRVAQVVTRDINGHYFNTKCFPGSTDLRTACGSLLTDCLTASSADSISSIFQTAIDNAVKMFK